MIHGHRAGFTLAEQIDIFIATMGVVHPGTRLLVRVS